MRVERLLDRFLGGHVTVGPFILFGRNAMHWAINVRVGGRGYLCMRLPLRCFGHWWPLYLYWSRNATPWAATWIIGNGWEGKERRTQLSGKRAALPRERAERND